MDEHIARIALNQGATPQVKTYLTHALGSVIATAKADQSLEVGYAFSPYGQTQKVGVENQQQGSENTSQYTGRENDNNGLYFYRARYYDPVLKRFISEDPIGLAGGINSHAYVGGNPISLNDPNGLWSESVHGKLIDGAFPGYGNYYRDVMKDGSRHVDGWWNQIPGIGNDYEHAMSSSSMSKSDSREAACKFVKYNLSMYKELRKQSKYENLAYHHLGRAMHTLMDSTSPSHNDFKGWSLFNYHEHGDFPKSKESSISKQTFQRTIDIMRSAEGGDDPCACLF
jgi:RHS repeat-associated protein